MTCMKQAAHSLEIEFGAVIGHVQTVPELKSLAAVWAEGCLGATVGLA